MDSMIGHNSGAAVFDEANERIATANRWITERPAIENAEQADKAGGFKKQLSDTRKAVDAARAAAKKPHMDAAKAVDEEFKPTIDLLDRAIAAVNAKITAWLQEQQRIADADRRAREIEARKQEQLAELKRREAEDAARKAGADALRAQQEADAAAKQAESAAKAAAEPVRAAVKGDFTTRAMTLRTTWRARITDEKAALKSYAKHPRVRAAALVAIAEIAADEARMNKGEHAPEGVEFYAETKAA